MAHPSSSPGPADLPTVVQAPASAADALHDAICSVLADVKRHCQAKGYVEGPGINNFVPHSCVAGLAMAALLTQRGRFEHYIAVAPEGHTYGYFFEQLGAKVLSVFVDFPPTRCQPVEDLSGIAGGRVLLIEDDVCGGGTLELVLQSLQPHRPASIGLYLGHVKGVQHLEHVPSAIAEVFVAEDCLPANLWQKHEEDFAQFFERGGSRVRPAPHSS